MGAVGKTLVVVPYVGEFGWELMNWQGRVRWVVDQGAHERVIICAKPDRRWIYKQPGREADCVFCPVGSMDLPGRPNEDHRVDDARRAILAATVRHIVERVTHQACAQAGVDTREAELLAPDYAGSLWPTTRSHQLFVPLRVRQPVTVDIVLVPRRRELASERNQPEAWWEDLAAQLERHGLSVETYASRLDEAVQQLSRARLAVGASTGGLHLASLCQCPHYVWGSGRESRWTPLGITNRQRYETVWNPFGTPCLYDESGWRPSMARVVDTARRALDEIGLVSGRSIPAWSLKPKWRIKRQLAGLLTPGPVRRLVPWRVRELVRERMV